MATFDILLKAEANDLAEFTVMLPSEIILESQYEVALTKFSYPIEIQNFSNEYFQYYSYGKKQYLHRMFPNGDYSTMDQVMGAFDNAFTNSNDSIYYNLGASAITNNVRITLNKDPSDVHAPYLELSNHLATILGFDSNVFAATTYATRHYNLYSNSRIMHINCNIVDLVNVSEGMSPCLAIVPYQRVNQFQQTYEPCHLNWCNVNTKNLSRISVSILNSFGKPYPFAGVGEILLSLKFRPIDF